VVFEKPSCKTALKTWFSGPLAWGGKSFENQLIYEQKLLTTPSGRTYLVAIHVTAPAFASGLAQPAPNSPDVLVAKPWRSWPLPRRVRLRRVAPTARRRNRSGCTPTRPRHRGAFPVCPPARPCNSWMPWAASELPLPVLSWYTRRAAGGHRLLSTGRVMVE
jgi:hypothetical protein